MIGVTGPPGRRQVLAALAGWSAEWRARGRSVAVLAVDPSRGGRAARCSATAPGSRPIRATGACSSARPRPATALGGLAPATRAAAAALAAPFDVVVIETVGVGQSETEVADVADTVAVVVQPAPGDVLQFLKAGIMEVPDVLVVTKADLGRGREPGGGRPAGRAARARRGATPPVCAVSSVASAERDRPSSSTRSTRTARALDLPRARARRARGCTRSADFAAEHGERGLRALGGRREAERWLERQDPELDVAALLSARSQRPGRGERVRRDRASRRAARRRVRPRCAPWRDSDLTGAGRRCRDPEIVTLDARPAQLHGGRRRARYLLQRHDARARRDRRRRSRSCRPPRRAAARVDLADALRLGAPPRRGRLLAGRRRPAASGHATRAVRADQRVGFRALGLERIDL